jgi:hypothetical protein
MGRGAGLDKGGSVEEGKKDTSVCLGLGWARKSFRKQVSHILLLYVSGTGRAQLAALRYYRWATACAIPLESGLDAKE